MKILPSVLISINRTGVLVRKEELSMNVVSLEGGGSGTLLVGLTRRKDRMVLFGNMRKPGRNGANLMLPYRGEFPADQVKK